MNKLLAYFHTPATFIQNGFKQVSTYVGIALFAFYAYFHHGINLIVTMIVTQIIKDIPTLTHNIMISPETVSLILQGIGGGIGFGFFAWRGKKCHAE